MFLQIYPQQRKKTHEAAIRMKREEDVIRVAIAGLGAIGLPVARWLDSGVAGLRLAAVAGSSVERAETQTRDFKSRPAIVELARLADHADVVVEALPPQNFAALAESVLAARRTLVVVSLTQLLCRMDLVDQARETGARIIAASGAIAGLDAIRAAAMGGPGKAVMRTSKPPRSLANAPFVREKGIALDDLQEPLLLYSGNVGEAARKFPANVNVAVALALAGWGPDETEYQVWADPALTRNVHRIQVETEAVRLDFAVENVPTDQNPATGRMTPLSVMAVLQRMVAPLTVGS